MSSQVDDTDHDMQFHPSSFSDLTTLQNLIPPETLLHSSLHSSVQSPVHSGFPLLLPNSPTFSITEGTHFFNSANSPRYSSSASFSENIMDPVPIYSNEVTLNFLPPTPYVGESISKQQPQLQ